MIETRLRSGDEKLYPDTTHVDNYTGHLLQFGLLSRRGQVTFEQHIPQSDGMISSMSLPVAYGSMTKSCVAHLENYIDHTADCMVLFSDLCCGPLVSSFVACDSATGSPSRKDVHSLPPGGIPSPRASHLQFFEVASPCTRSMSVAQVAYSSGAFHDSLRYRQD